MVRSDMPHDLDRNIDEVLRGLGYEACHEAHGLFSLFVVNKAEGDAIADRIRAALQQPGASNPLGDDWMIECWSLDSVRWADYGEEVPRWSDGTPVAYAVVVACPWGPLREPFEDQVDRMLDDVVGLESSDRTERKWTLRYDHPSKADPTALVTTLRRSLGWWPCYGLEFRAERSGTTVRLEVS